MSAPATGREIRLSALEELVAVPARGFDVAGLEVVLVCVGGRHFAYENRCPHRGTSLDWAPGRFLSDDGSFLQCATHGALFERETGRCIAGPCVGEGLRPLALREVDGYVCVVIE